MKLRRFTPQQLADRLAIRPAEYAKEIEPAIVRTDGQQFIDIEHPTYIRASAKYAVARTPKGVGDHLHDVIHETTWARPTPGCGCESMRAKMNAWGPDGCREHRAEIIAWMCEQAKSLTVRQQMRAARRLKVLTFRAGAEKMLDEAIRRAEADHAAAAGRNGTVEKRDLRRISAPAGNRAGGLPPQPPDAADGRQTPAAGNQEA